MPGDRQQADRCFGFEHESRTKGAGQKEGTEPLILVSNRGPVEFSFDDDGGIEPRRGAGGVVSGLLCAVRNRPVTWISLAMSEADREAAHQPISPPPGLEHVALRMVDVPPRMYSRYYNGISNTVLWFAQHYLLNPQQTSKSEQRIERDWEKGYRAVNERVAREVIDALATQPTTPVLFQDYHLYLAPALVRERFPEARLAHFVHIPWPDARYWEMLPEVMVRAIFAGLASCDTVGFQTKHDAHNFLTGVTRFLPDAQVQWETMGSGTVHVAGRRIQARSFPIAVTPDEVRRSAQASGPLGQVVELSQQLRLDPDHKLLVRVDRIEPTKNIVRGFQAYERMLHDHKHLHGNVTFLALLVPSRQGMAQYRAYERQVRRLIERINTRYGQPGWQPVVAIIGNNRARALACMHRYDVLLVNPLIDGMNLVVKEGGLLNRRHGVVVLSRTAGAYEQLGEHVLGVPPMDVPATAEALYQALYMDQDERIARASKIRTFLQGEDAATWLSAQVDSLPALERVPEPVAAPTPARHERAALEAETVLGAADASEGRRVAVPVGRDDAASRLPNSQATGRVAYDYDTVAAKLTPRLDGPDSVETVETLDDLDGVDDAESVADEYAL